MNESIDPTKIKLPANYVLIKPDDDMEKYHLDGKETSIYIGKSSMQYVDPLDSLDFEQKETVTSQADHWAITGTVIKNPERISFYGRKINKIKARAGSELGHDDIIEMNKLFHKSVTYDCSLETKEGDKVLFDPHAHIRAVENLEFIETDQGLMYLIRYDHLRAIIREDGIYPLNSIVFFKWERKKELIKGIFDLEDRHISDAPPKEALIGEVYSVGEIVNSSLSNLDVIPGPNISIKKGDRFLFTGVSANNVESDGHHHLFGGEDILMIRQSDILALVD